MPVARVKLPDGRIGRFEVPEGTTPEQVLEFAKNNLPTQAQQPTQEVKQQEVSQIGSLLGANPQTKEEQEANKRAFGLTARNVIQGVGNLASFAPDILGAGVNVLAGKEIFPSLGGMVSETLTNAGFPEPETPSERVEGDIIQGLTGGAGVGRNIASRITGAASGATSGAASSTAREAGASPATQIGLGLAAGVGTGAIPGLVSGAKAAGRSLIPKVDETTKTLATRAKDLDIPLSVSQVAPTRAIQTAQKASQQLPFSGVTAFEGKQITAFNRAVAKTLGLKSDDLSPETITKFRESTKGSFNRILKDKDVIVNSQELADITGLKQSVRELISEDLAKVVDKNVDIAVKTLKTGANKAEKISSLRSRMVNNAAGAKGGVGEYIGDIVDKLDDIAKKSLSEEEVSQLAKLRKQWRNFKTIQPLLEKATNGQINPTSLQNRIANNRFIDSSKILTGEDDLVDLGRIGKQFLRKPGGSDTFEKGIFTAGALGSVVEPSSTPLILGALGANRGLQGLNRSSKLLNAVIDGGISDVSATTALSGIAKAGAQSVLPASIGTQGN